MKLEYDNLADLAESFLPFGKYISERHRLRIRKLTAPSASLLWSTYCYPGRFDFRAHGPDAVDATLVSTKPFDGLDEEMAIEQVAEWLCSMIDAAKSETVYLLRPEGLVDGFEVSWEVFLATWYCLLPFISEGYAVIPSKNVVIEFCAGDCSVYRLSLSDAAIVPRDDLNEWLLWEQE